MSTPISFDNYLPRNPLARIVAEKGLTRVQELAREAMKQIYTKFDEAGLIECSEIVPSEGQFEIVSNKLYGLRNNRITHATSIADEEVARLWQLPSSVDGQAIISDQYSNGDMTRHPPIAEGAPYNNGVNWRISLNAQLTEPLIHALDRFMVKYGAERYKIQPGSLDSIDIYMCGQPTSEIIEEIITIAEPHIRKATGDTRPIRLPSDILYPVGGIGFKVAKGISVGPEFTSPAADGPNAILTDRLQTVGLLPSLRHGEILLGIPASFFPRTLPSGKVVTGGVGKPNKSAGQMAAYIRVLNHIENYVAEQLGYPPVHSDLNALLPAADHVISPTERPNFLKKLLNPATETPVEARNLP